MKSSDHKRLARRVDGSAGRRDEQATDGVAHALQVMLHAERRAAQAQVYPPGISIAISKGLQKQQAFDRTGLC